MIKPLVSICILAYNQEDYIEAAIDGALAQSYEPLEIIISDDGSKDATFDIIQDKVNLYDGKHKLICFQNKKNLGFVPHVNHVSLNLATGEYLLLAAGDDIMYPDKIDKAMYVFRNNTDVEAVGGFNTIINVKGDITNCPKSLNSMQEYTIKDHLSKPYHISHRVFKRSVFSFFGPLNSSCPTEDTTLLLRSLLLGKAILLKEPLTYYRVHQKGISFGQNMYKLDFKAIYNQYITDIDLAYAKSIISLRTKELLYKKYYAYYKKENLNYKIGTEERNSNLFFNLLPHLIFSRYFTIREKLFKMKQMILLSVNA